MVLDFSVKESVNLINLVKGYDVVCMANYNGNSCRVVGYNASDRSLSVLVGGRCDNGYRYDTVDGMCVAMSKCP